MQESHKLGTERALHTRQHLHTGKNDRAHDGRAHTTRQRLHVPEDPRVDTSHSHSGSRVRVREGLPVPARRPAGWPPFANSLSGPKGHPESCPCEGTGHRLPWQGCPPRTSSEPSIQAEGQARHRAAREARAAGRVRAPPPHTPAGGHARKAAATTQLLARVRSPGPTRPRRDGVTEPAPSDPTSR